MSAAHIFKNTDVTNKVTFKSEFRASTMRQTTSGGQNIFYSVIPLAAFKDYNSFVVNIFCETAAANVENNNIYIFNKLKGRYSVQNNGVGVTTSAGNKTNSSVSISSMSSNSAPVTGVATIANADISAVINANATEFYTVAENVAAASITAVLLNQPINENSVMVFTYSNNLVGGVPNRVIELNITGVYN